MNVVKRESIERLVLTVGKIQFGATMENPIGEKFVQLTVLIVRAKRGR